MLVQPLFLSSGARLFAFDLPMSAQTKAQNAKATRFRVAFCLAERKGFARRHWGSAAASPGN